MNNKTNPPNVEDAQRPIDGNTYCEAVKCILSDFEPGEQLDDDARCEIHGHIEACQELLLRSSEHGKDWSLSVWYLLHRISDLNRGLH